MKKKIVLVCMTICLMFLMTACGDERLNDATAPEASQTPGTTDDVDGVGDDLADDAEDVGEDLKDGAEDVGDALTGDDTKENR